MDGSRLLAPLRGSRCACGFSDRVRDATMDGPGLASDKQDGERERLSLGYTTGRRLALRRNKPGSTHRRRFCQHLSPHEMDRSCNTRFDHAWRLHSVRSHARSGSPAHRNGDRSRGARMVKLLRRESSKGSEPRGRSTLTVLRKYSWRHCRALTELRRTRIIAGRPYKNSEELTSRRILTRAQYKQIATKIATK